MKKITCLIILCVSFFILSNYVFAGPPNPPPPGKIWLEVGGKWILVIAPPGNGPYIWRENKWVLDKTPPPPNSEWVPGHWVTGHRKGNKWIAGHWVPGYWETVSSPGPGTRWILGHWKGNKWIPGHWAGSPPHGKRWVPGHRGPGGRWIPGHWR